MKIATWNVERLKHKAQLEQIKLACERVNADILVLTETDSRISLGYTSCFPTPRPTDTQHAKYATTENRVSIFTNYKCVKKHPTYDELTALCVELETERGNLLVYGTIIGIYGNRHPSFEQDLSKQIADIKRLSAGDNNLCVCGDFNCSFTDNYYYTKSGRSALLQSFSDNGIELLTSDRREYIDHIAVSEQFVTDCTLQVEEWNYDKELSDHKGIAVNITTNEVLRS
ncbi:hypothetical protein FACS1894217_11670 [Clostridia bacterium]|nr:hypothetical protein FACS1894217_11670 [Clostridia bacterium]